VASKRRTRSCFGTTRVWRGASRRPCFAERSRGTRGTFSPAATRQALRTAHAAVRLARCSRTGRRSGSPDADVDALRAGPCRNPGADGHTDPDQDGPKRAKPHPANVWMLGTTGSASPVLAHHTTAAAQTPKPLDPTATPRRLAKDSSVRSCLRSDGGWSNVLKPRAPPVSGSTCRSPPATPTPAPPCAATEPTDLGRHSTHTLASCWPPAPEPTAACEVLHHGRAPQGVTWWGFCVVLPCLRGAALERQLALPTGRRCR